MSIWKKVGVILILVGFCVPTLALFFADDYFPHKGFIWNIQNSKIVVWDSYEKPITAEEYLHSNSRLFIPDVVDHTYYYIPLNYFMAFCVILIATGIGFLILSKKSEK